MNIVIQEKRRELGLTQEQLAQYLGVSTPAVSKWEKGITCPDIAILPSLARLLRIDLNTLFCFHEELTQQELSDFCNLLKVTAEESGVAPYDKATAGRCNSQNVSYLYVANDQHTAVAEVRPFIRDAISMAILQPKHDLKLIDFYYKYDEI